MERRLQVTLPHTWGRGEGMGRIRQEAHCLVQGEIAVNASF